MSVSSPTFSPVSAARPPLFIAILLGNRLLLAVIAYIALTFFSHHIVPGTWRALPDQPWLDGWLRWDSGWYHQIATQGYDRVVLPGHQSNTAFFPLLPSLANVLSWIIGSVAWSGLIVSHVSTLIASTVLFYLVRDRFGYSVAVRTLILLYCFPYSFYLNSFHTEPLFLCLVVCSFFYAERGQLWKAAVFAAAASATRNIGVLLTIGLAISYLESIEFKPARIDARALFLLLCPSGLLLHMLYLWQHCGTPWQFVWSQAAPGWAGGALLGSGSASLSPALLWRLVGHPQLLLFVVPSLWLLWRARSQLPLSYLAWATVTLLISISSPGSLGRFLVVLFPVFVAAALRPLSRRTFGLIAGMLLILLCVQTFRQVLGMWVAG